MLTEKSQMKNKYIQNDSAFIQFQIHKLTYSDRIAMISWGWGRGAEMKTYIRFEGRKKV